MLHRCYGSLMKHFSTKSAKSCDHLSGMRSTGSWIIASNRFSKVSALSWKGGAPLASSNAKQPNAQTSTSLEYVWPCAISGETQLGVPFWVYRYCYCSVRNTLNPMSAILTSPLGRQRMLSDLMSRWRMLRECMDCRPRATWYKLNLQKFSVKLPCLSTIIFVRSPPSMISMNTQRRFYQS